MPIHMTGKPKPSKAPAAQPISATALGAAADSVQKETFKVKAQYVELTGTSTPWIQRKSKKKDGVAEIKVSEEQTVEELRRQIVQTFGSQFAAWEVERSRQTAEAARELGQNVRLYYRNKPLRYTRRDGKLEIELTLVECGLRNGDEVPQIHWMVV